MKAIQDDCAWSRTWLENRCLYKIEAEQELPSFRGWAKGMSDLAHDLGIVPKECRRLIWDLVEKGYLAPPEVHKGRIRFALLKPLGGQYAVAFDHEKQEICLFRQF